MKLTDHAPYILMQPGDYDWAVIHITWYREGNDRHLLFGFVELIPAELPKPEGTSEINFKVKLLKKQGYHYFKRTVITADTALKWYDDCRQGNIDLLENAKPAQLQHNEFKEEPNWPALVTTTELPFVSFSARAHHLLQGILSQPVKLVQDHTKSMVWLSERMFFDFTKYPELIGSLHLVVPNPVYRSYSHTLGETSDGRECSDIHFITRKGQSLDNLSIHIDESRPLGKVDCRTYPVVSPYMQIVHKGQTDRIGLSVLSETHGVLDFDEPLPFRGQFNVNLSLGGAKKIVKVPGPESETYERTIHTQGTSMVVGKTSTETTAANILNIAKFKRKRVALAEELGQTWFYNNHTNAREFIRKQIGSARKRVMIVDPYFASVELFRYALATSYADVQIDIVTSSDVLKAKDTVLPQYEAGDVLQQQLEAHQEFAKFNVTVMTGSNVSPIHDRFLVIDDTVWFVGNSLHTIGQRAGMMIKLPNPAPVLQALEEIIQGDRGQLFADWLGERKKLRENRNTFEKIISYFIKIRNKLWA